MTLQNLDALSEEIAKMGFLSPNFFSGHKNCYYSACIGDMSLQILVHNWEFSRSASFTVSFTTAPTDPCCHGNEKSTSGHKIGHSSAYIEDKCKILVSKWGF